MLGAFGEEGEKIKCRLIGIPNLLEHRLADNPVTFGETKAERLR